MFFFRPNEAADGTLSDQLRNYEVDTVIWLHPGRTAMETLLRLSDMAIRVIADFPDRNTKYALSVLCMEGARY